MRSKIQESYIGGFLYIPLNRLSTYIPKTQIRGQRSSGQDHWSRSKIRRMRSKVKDGTNIGGFLSTVFLVTGCRSRWKGETFCKASSGSTSIRPPPNCKESIKVWK